MSVAIKLLTSFAFLSRSLIFLVEEKLLAFLNFIKLISFCKSTQIRLAFHPMHLFLILLSFLTIFGFNILFALFENKNAGKKKGEVKKAAFLTTMKEGNFKQMQINFLKVLIFFWRVLKAIQYITYAKPDILPPDF